MTQMTLIYTEYWYNLKKSVAIRVICVIRVLFQVMSNTRLFKQEMNSKRELK